MLFVELILLFGGLPLLLALDILPLHPLTVLWLACVYCLIMLWCDPRFYFDRMWQSPRMADHWRFVVLRFLILAAVITLLLLIFTPELLFDFPKEQPRLWLMVMLFYPLFSVFPQGLVYRLFLLHRYRYVIPSPMARACLSAAAFGYMHIAYRHPLPVLLTLVGGWMFARTQQRTGSVVIASFEHALYGCFLFTVGWGQFFYFETLPAR